MTTDIHKAAGIIIQNRKLLLVRSRGRTTFASPGGKLEPGETAQQAVARELREELGITANQADLEPFGTFNAEAYDRPGVSITMDVFVVKKYQGEIKPDHEIEELLWVGSDIPEGIEVGSVFGHDVIPRLKQADLIG